MSLTANVEDHWTAVAAVVGVIGGAVITAVAAAFSASRRIAEVKLSYEQRLAETYLSNARSYTASIYQPLAIELYRLRRAGLGYRRDAPTSTTGQTDLRDCSLAFTTAIDELLERGAGAFLTTALEQRLTTFVDFLKASTMATEPLLRQIVSIKIAGLPGFQTESLANRGGEGGIRWRLFPFPGRLHFERELLGAPLDSEQFGDHLAVELAELGLLIKQVTLGAHDV